MKTIDRLNRELTEIYESLYEKHRFVNLAIDFLSEIGKQESIDQIAREELGLMISGIIKKTYDSMRRRRLKILELSQEIKEMEIKN